MEESPKICFGFLMSAIAVEECGGRDGKSDYEMILYHTFENFTWACGLINRAISAY